MRTLFWQGRFYRTFFCDCPTISIFWKNVEKKILAETNCNIKLNSTKILFGVDKQNVTKEQYVEINHILLVGKMCISIFKKTKSMIPIEIIFEREMNIRKPKIKRQGLND